MARQKGQETEIRKGERKGVELAQRVTVPRVTGSDQARPNRAAHPQDCIPAPHLSRQRREDVQACQQSWPQPVDASSSPGAGDEEATREG